jgi:anti-sigma factor (TIGR02949 family)
MNCSTTGSWIDALLDGELDPKNAAEVESHLSICPACKRQYEVKRALSSNMRRLELAYTAPESLRRRISEALDVAAAEPTSTQPAPARPAPARMARGPSRWFLMAGWPVALAASVMLATVALQQRSQEADEVVAAHIRSLLAGHLNDVVSSSHHTVKPWFAGKIDFAPPVPDLSSLGFELVGGRLDYLAHQQVAAVVYRKHGHIINVLVSLPGRDAASLPHTTRAQGYSLRAWRQSGLDLVAVSDIDPLELANLEKGFEMPSAPSAEPTG